MVTVRFRGRFRCQRIIDSWLPVQDPRGSGAGCRCTTHDLIFISNFALFSVFKKILFNVNHFVIISRFFLHHCIVQRFRQSLVEDANKVVDIN